MASSDMMALRNYVTQKDGEQFSRLPEGRSSFAIVFLFIFLSCCFGLSTSIVSSTGAIAVSSDRNAAKVRGFYTYIFVFRDHCGEGQGVG